MAAFDKIYGYKKDEKAITSGEAIQKLRETEEMLMKKQDFLEKKRLNKSWVLLERMGQRIKELPCLP